MARTSVAPSATSQFFINFFNHNGVRPQPISEGCAVFGNVSDSGRINTVTSVAAARSVAIPFFPPTRVTSGASA